MTPVRGSRLTTKTGSKDIVKAANDFASRSVLEKQLTKTKSTGAKGKEILSTNKTSQIKIKSKGNPKSNPKGKRGKSTQSDKTDGTGPKKVATLARPGGRIQTKVERKTREKVVSKGKQRRQE